MRKRGQIPFSPRSVSDAMARRFPKWNLTPFLPFLLIVVFATKCTLTPFPAFASDEEKPVERAYVSAPAAPAFQTWDDAQKKSTGCVSCHTKSDRKTMHANEAVVLGCTDCHGGDANVFAPPGETYSADDAGKTRGWSAGYLATMDKAH